MPSRRAAVVQYHPVIDAFATTPAITPSFALLFAGCFAACAVLGMRAPRFALAALIFVIPFDFAHTLGITTIGFPKVALLGVLIGLLARRDAWRALATRDARLILFAFGAILVGIGLSALTALHQGASLREAFKWIEYALLFVAVLVAYEVDRDDMLMRRAFGLSIVFVCASAIAQEFVGSPWAIAFGKGVAPRISGAIEGPNQLAGYLTSAIAFLGAWNVSRRSHNVSALLALSGVTLLLTFSRGGTIGALAACAILIVYARMDGVRSLVGLFSGMTLGVVLDGLWIFAARTLSALQISYLDARYSGGVGTRSELWQAALAMWRTYPLFGVGAGNYELELTQYGLAGVRTHANSWYLQSLAEGGMVGLLATLAFLAILVTTLVRRASASPWALAALAATVGLASHQVADYLVFYPKVAEPWVVLVALGIATRPTPCD